MQRILLVFICTIVGHVFGETKNPNCQKGEKKMDRAWVNIELGHEKVMEDQQTLAMYGNLEACYKCEPTFIVNISLSPNCTVQLPSMFPHYLEIREITKSNTFGVWNETVTLRQHSEYEILINKTGQTYQVSFSLRKTSQDPHIPIYVALSIFILGAILWGVVNYTGIASKPVQAIRVYFEPEEPTPRGLIQDITEPTDNEPPTEPEVIIIKRRDRVRSLDAFRGICLVIMIFVNYGGGGYWFFDHSYWNGLTVADLVFPWFTWIIGTAIALSFKNLFAKGTTKLQLALKIVKRTLILFFLGFALESSTGCAPVSMSSIRIPGVLQRLAVSYCVVALLQVMFAQDYVENPNRHRGCPSLRDIVPYWLEWFVMLALVGLHLILTFGIKVPGCPRGYTGPGGLANHGKYKNCTGGSAGYIDRLLFGEKHIYQSPTCKEIYQTTVPYDPEGTLGTMTSIFMCFLGLQAGKILVLFEDWKARIIRWLVWGVLLGVIAGCMCRFSQNEGWIPLNKNLWSLSFVLALASMAFILLSACYIIIDVFKFWSGAPFFFTGMNSILVYVSHLVFTNYFPVSWKVPETHAALLALHLWGPILWTSVAAILYYKKIFVAI